MPPQTLRINLDFDCTELLKKTKNYDKRLAYNTIVAINEGLLAVQAAERANVRERVIVRNSRFIDENIARVQKASVKAKRPWGEVFIVQKPRFLMPYLETGGYKKPGLFPELSHPTLGMPTLGGIARPERTFPVPRSLYQTVLKFKAARGGRVYIGRRFGLYAIKDVGIFQRLPGMGDSRMVYSYRKKVLLPKRLGWLKLARVVAERTAQAALFRECAKSWARAGNTF